MISSWRATSTSRAGRPLDQRRVRRARVGDPAAAHLGGFAGVRQLALREREPFVGGGARLFLARHRRPGLGLARLERAPLLPAARALSVASRSAFRIRRSRFSFAFATSASKPTMAFSCACASATRFAICWDSCSIVAAIAAVCSGEPAERLADRPRPGRAVP